MLPAVIYMLFFVGYPIVSNFILSFQDVTVKTLSSPNKPFAGIENYQTLFQDEVLRTSIINTLLFTVLCLVFQVQTRVQQVAVVVATGVIGDFSDVGLQRLALCFGGQAALVEIRVATLVAVFVVDV